METEKKYQTGFNSGYLIAKHEPELLAQIIKTLEPSTAYVEGFFSGKEQFHSEITRDHLNDLEQLRSKSKDRDRSTDREK